MLTNITTFDGSQVHVINKWCRLCNSSSCPDPLCVMTAALLLLEIWCYKFTSSLLFLSVTDWMSVRAMKIGLVCPQWFRLKKKKKKKAFTQMKKCFMFLSLFLHRGLIVNPSFMHLAPGVEKRERRERISFTLLPLFAFLKMSGTELQVEHYKWFPKQIGWKLYPVISIKKVPLQICFKAYTLLRLLFCSTWLS